MFVIYINYFLKGYYKMDTADEFMIEDEPDDDLEDDFSIETGQFDLLADFPLFILE